MAAPEANLDHVLPHFEDAIMPQIMSKYQEISVNAKFNEIEAILQQSLTVKPQGMNTKWPLPYGYYFKAIVNHAVYEDEFGVTSMKPNDDFFKRLHKKTKYKYDTDRLNLAATTCSKIRSKRPPDFLDKLRLRLEWEERLRQTLQAPRIVDGIHKDLEQEEGEEAHQAQENVEPEDVIYKMMNAEIQGPPVFLDRQMEKTLKIPIERPCRQVLIERATFKAPYFGNHGAVEITGMELVTIKEISAYASVLNALKGVAELGYCDAILSITSLETPARLVFLLDELYHHKKGQVLTDVMHLFFYQVVFDMHGAPLLADQTPKPVQFHWSEAESNCREVTASWNLDSGCTMTYCEKCNMWFKETIAHVKPQESKNFMNGHCPVTKVTCSRCGDPNADSKISVNGHAVIVIPEIEEKPVTIKDMFKKPSHIKRTVEFSNGATYICKTATFTYQPKCNADEATPNALHTVALFFPKNPRHTAQIIDPSHQFTEPGHKGPVPNMTYYKMDENQVGFIDGLFYVRKNHPTKIEAEAKRQQELHKESWQRAKVNEPRVLAPRAARAAAKSNIEKMAIQSKRRAQKNLPGSDSSSEEEAEGGHTQEAKKGRGHAEQGGGCGSAA